MIAADGPHIYDQFSVYSRIMAHSPGNATLVAASTTSTRFGVSIPFGVSMPESPCGRLAAVTRPTVPDVLWAVQENRAYEAVTLFTGETPIDPGVVQITYWRPEQPDDLDSDVARYPGCAGVARID